MPKEIIKKFVKVDDQNLGYEIHTNQQVITVFISNSAGCCENWGIITTEDNLQDFVGSEFQSIEVVDTDYATHPLTKDMYFDEGSACFVDVNTSNGKLQFVLYNIHNGYYGHGVSINSKQFNHETSV